MDELVCARRSRHAHGIEGPFGHGRRRLDQAPGLLIAENFSRQLRVQGVSRAMGHHMTDDRPADQREVANHIQNLVANKLVFEPQRVQHAGVANDDGVLERAAERQAVLAQPLDFLQEAERARGRDVVGEGGFGNALGARLVPQQRMVKADGVADLEVIRRVDGNALVAVGNLHRLQNF